VRHPQKAALQEFNHSRLFRQLVMVAPD